METNQIQNIQNEEVEIDLRDILFALLNKAWIIILVTLIFGGIAGAYTKFAVTPIYKSTSQLYIVSSNSITSISDLQIGSQLTNDYMVLIKSRPVVETVIADLKLEDMTYEQLCNNVVITIPTDSHIINITVSNKDPKLAKKIADDFAVVSQKQMAEIMKTDQPSISEKGVVAEYPSSPNMKKNCIIAALLGFILSCGVVILMHVMDDNIKSPDDIEKYLGLETLGSIPIENKQSKSNNSTKRKKHKK